MQQEQRWREGSTRWVKPDRPYFDPDRYVVRQIPWQDAVDFIVTHHYSGSYPSIVVRHGMIDRSGRREKLVGVATYGMPAGRHTLRKWLAGQRGLELNRFVLLDEVGFNAETWFLGRSFLLLTGDRPELRGVFAMSDPHPRADIEGRIVMPGHVGQIYQGHGGRLIGRSDPKNLWLDDLGRAIPPRAASKLGKESGGEGFYRRFREAGAPPRRRGESPRAYMKRALREGPFRPFTNPGNYVYVWDRFGPKRERAWLERTARGVDELQLRAELGGEPQEILARAVDLQVPGWMAERIAQAIEGDLEIPGPADFQLVALPFPAKGTGVTGARGLDLDSLRL